MAKMSVISVNVELINILKKRQLKISTKLNKITPFYLVVEEILEIGLEHADAENSKFIKDV